MSGHTDGKAQIVPDFATTKASTELRLQAMLAAGVMAVCGVPQTRENIAERARGLICEEDIGIFTDLVLRELDDIRDYPITGGEW